MVLSTPQVEVTMAAQGAIATTPSPMSTRNAGAPIRAATAAAAAAPALNAAVATTTFPQEQAARAAGFTESQELRELHTAVLSGDAGKLREMLGVGRLTRSRRGRVAIIDDVDEHGNRQEPTPW